ncbi:MAG: PP2C family protein-serine/threonine phosphatase, partial [Bryobacteraceae bacterium]
GMLRDAAYREDSVLLKSGDLVVAYTDGVCDLRSLAGEEWGKQRLVDSVMEYAGFNAREIVRRVMAEMDAFANGEEQFDDMTLWIARVGPTEATKPVEEEQVAFAA